jgi:uncharacterized Ntn-hydrolase superfamily protein
VKRITEADPGRDTRQVAVIDATGRSAVYTGARVLARNHDPKDPVHLGGYAGHVRGATFSAQGNTLASEAVVKAMGAAFEATTGTLAERLMAALEAGQAQGGDTRGMQSAGILVVRPLPPGGDSTVERIVDIRVDDAPDPFTELRRLLRITQGEPGRIAKQAEALAGQGKFAEAVAEQRRALEIVPHGAEAHFALAQRLAQAGDRSAALASLREAVRLHRNLRRLAATDPLFETLRATKDFQALIAEK